MSSASWTARYNSANEITNTNKVFEERSKALTEGCAYLIKIKFVNESDFILEEAFRDKEGALAVAEHLTKCPSNVAWVIVNKMHGTDRNGHRRYQYLTFVARYTKIA